MSKLNAVYDCIDDGNYKMALNHANKVLKKRYNVVAEALKALCLLRLDEPSEAVEICDRLSITIDDHVLHIVSIVYSSLRQHEKIVKMYENAMLAVPNNENFAQLHFYSSLRHDFNPSSLQKLAVNLHRKFKKPMYLYWNIVTTWLQGKFDASKGKMCSILALRMMEKAEIRTSELLFLLIDMLNEAGRHQDVNDLITSHRGDVCKMPIERTLIELEAVLNLKDFETVISRCQKELKSYPDRWNFWELYVRALDEMKISETEAEKHLRFASSIKEAHRTVRGPYLAELRMLVLVRSANSTVKKLLVDYFINFGDRHCFFEDTKFCYLNFDQTEVADLIETYRQNLPAEENEKQQLKLVNVSKLETLNYLRYVSEKDVDNSTIQDLLDLFGKSFAFGTSITTEKHFGDDFLLCAIKMLQTARYENGILNLTLLQHGLDKSPCNYFFKCLLIKEMLENGMSEGILDHVKTLEIKHILLDTIGHIYLNGIENVGNYDVARSLMAQVLKIYDSNETETPDMTVKCFKNETYSKIPEFALFYQRLKYSKQKAMVLAQVHRLKLVYFFLEDREDPFPELLIYDDAVISQCLANDNREQILLDFPKSWSMDNSVEHEDDYIRLYHSVARLFKDYLRNTPATVEVTERCKSLLYKVDTSKFAAGKFTLVSLLYHFGHEFDETSFLSDISDAISGECDYVLESPVINYRVLSSVSTVLETMSTYKAILKSSEKSAMLKARVEKQILPKVLMIAEKLKHWSQPRQMNVPSHYLLEREELEESLTASKKQLEEENCKTASRLYEYLQKVL